MTDYSHAGHNSAESSVHAHAKGHEGRRPPDCDVLMIDDDEFLGQLQQELLSSEGYRVALASDPAAGLKIMHECRPRLVLCDLSLQGEMDGYGFARCVRAQETEETADPAAPLLYVLTAHAAEDVQKTAQDAGFDGVLTKPLDLDRLKKILPPQY